jgi:hypothetical protein
VRYASILLVSLTAAPAMAQDGEQKPVTLTVSTYAWVPTLSGTSSLGPLKVPVRVTPKDFAEGIQIGGMGSIRVDGLRRFAYVEGIVMNYDNDNFSPFFGQAVKSKLRYVDAGLGIHRQVRLDGDSVLQISPYVGVHHLSIKSQVKGSLINTSAEGTWTNPVAGITFALPINRRLAVTSKIDGAGFGLGRTDYVSGAVSLDWRVAKRLKLNLGYRYAHGRFDNATGLGLDLHGGGPVIGLQYVVPIGR